MFGGRDSEMMSAFSMSMAEGPQGEPLDRQQAEAVAAMLRASLTGSGVYSAPSEMAFGRGPELSSGGRRGPGPAARGFPQRSDVADSDRSALGGGAAGALGGSGGAPGGAPAGGSSDADYAKEIKEFFAKDEAKDVDFSKLKFTDPDDKVDKSVVEKAKTIAKRALDLVNKHEGTKCPMRKLMFQLVKWALTDFISEFGPATKDENSQVSFEKFKTGVSNLDTILKIVETLDEDKDTIKRLKTTVLIVGLCLGLGLPLLFGGVTFALFKTGRITWALSAAASEVPAAGV